MSSRALRWLVVVALVAAGVLFWQWWRSPQRQIYRRLDELAGELDKHGEESGLGAAATAHGVLDFFAPGFFVRARPYEGELRDPQELAGAVLRFRGLADRIDVSVSDRHLTLAPDARSGELVFLAAVTLDRGNGPGHESWRVRSLWIDDAGTWRISELELVERVEGGGLLGL